MQQPPVRGLAAGSSCNPRSDWNLIPGIISDPPSPFPSQNQRHQDFLTLWGQPFQHPLAMAGPKRSRPSSAERAIPQLGRGGDAGMGRRCWDGDCFGMLHTELQEKPLIPVQIPQGAGITLPARGVTHTPPQKALEAPLSGHDTSPVPGSLQNIPKSGM